MMQVSVALVRLTKDESRIVRIDTNALHVGVPNASVASALAGSLLVPGS